MQKSFTTQMVKQAPTIDGNLNDSAWIQVPDMQQLIQSTPRPGESCSQRTSIKMIYDDEAVFISARMFEENPDSIYNFLTERDWFGNADFFIVVFNSYQDGINGEGFAVTPAGVQIDIKYSTIGESSNWDAVWESATQIDSLGWTAELKIPYSALRFPEVDQQLWGINFGREIRRKRERSWWNFINPRIDGFLTQCGVVEGIDNIEPPPRLFFFPYTSSYAEFNSAPNAEDGYSFNMGMDIKYGLSDAFTLDMTLIPDFGQTRFDNRVLNLSPFEVQFNEYRQFFTEGVELFNKADLFYSRRIGGIPINRSQVESQIDSTEEIIENPRQGRLLNATKVSGRNKKGLGVGFFNAVEDQSEAVIRDRETGNKRSVQTNPLTNYNVLVLDQVLRNNSFATLTNTNVMRQGAAYDANVSRLDLQLANKENEYAFLGYAAMSHRFFEESIRSGNSWNVTLAKISGNFRWDVSQTVIGDEYNTNDLGFQTIRNVSRSRAYLAYRKFKPFSIFNRMRQEFDAVYERLYAQGDFVNLGFSYNSVYTLRNFFTFGLNAGLEPIETFDYFETRTFDRYYQFPTNYSVGGFISSDYSKPFALDGRFSYRKFDELGRYNLSFELEPRFRPNDKLFFTPGYINTQRKNEMGYLQTVNDTITFGRRDVQIHEAYVNGSYIFNNKMALSLNLRHYWSTAEYNRFNDVNEEGELTPSNYDTYLADGTTENDISFHAFNIDLIYRWRFAPGSDISIAWKNSILQNGTPMGRSYYRGLENALSAPQVNNFSIRLLYFIDYLSLKKG
ncbi:MAG: DUF5916 domain-containing protein [Vicingaceae bacterium]